MHFLEKVTAATFFDALEVVYCRKGRKVIAASACYNPHQKGGTAMQRIVRLIEDTLDAEITPAELAEKSG